MEKKKLKNSLIRDLCDNGLINTTDHSVDVKHAYKVYNFRREVLKAGDVILEKRAELVKAAGIEDAEKYDERKAELKKKVNRTEDEQKELDEMEVMFTRFRELYDQLLADETELDIKAIPYEEYHKLANENKETPFFRVLPDGQRVKSSVDFFFAFRDDLENILWVAPVED